MKISAIVAASKNDVIAKKGIIPWSLPADLKRVKSVTMGRPLIMGRATYEPIGRNLPGRLNIVVSRNPDFKVLPGAVLVSSLEEALKLNPVKKAAEVFIFGGQSIFEAAMPFVQKIYLTRIHANIDGDRFFRYDPEQWVEVSREIHKKDSINPYDFDFITLERKKK
jgi:dihydrofolate reductase